MSAVRKAITMAATFGAIVSGSSIGAAAPFSVPSGLQTARPDALIQDVRVFCYNRRTGRFKHWGACRTSVPRVYCARRGRFLHWGSCYR